MIIDSPIVSGSFLSTGSLSQIGNAQITGSLTVSGSAISLVDGSYSGSGANLFGIPATGITGLNLSQISSGSVSASISPNLGLLINTAVSASNFTGSYTGSLTGIATSASYAAFALTSSYSLGGSGFPFSGSAVITGSLVVSGSGLTITGSVAISTLTTGSGVRYVIADADGLISAQTASAVIFTTQQTIATAGQTNFPITNGYSTGYVTVFVNGTKLNADEFTDTSGTNIVLATGSMVNDVVEFQKYLPASGVSNNALRSINYFTTTLGQTNFTVNYTPGLLDVFYNGSKLSNTEYTAANGTSITLATGSNAGDTLEVDVYSYQVGAFSGIGGAGVARELAFYNTSNSITGSNKVTYDGATFSVTGSFLVTGSSTFTVDGPAIFSGSVTAVGGIVGTADSASYATTASYSENAKLFDSKPLSIFATTGSNGFTANQAITGSLTVTGQIIAQSINVQQVTSSIIYSSGSNVFGCDINSRQTFTGSFYQTGSVAIFNSSVGIGTTPGLSSPPLLHLYNNTEATRIRLEYKPGTAGAIDFYSGSTANWSIVVDNNQAYGKIENRFLGADAIRFYNSTNNVILNATAGCVGIGTTCLTAAKLTIGGVTVGQTTSALDINASGNGTYQRGIRVLNSSMVASDSILIQVGKSDDLLNAGQMTFNYCANSSTSNYLEFGLFACDRILNIVGNGRVGLGLINPDTQLHSRSDSQINAIKSESTHASGYGLFQSKNSTSGLWQAGAWPDNTYRIGLSGVADYFSINADGGIRVIGGSLAIRNSGNSITYGLMLRAGAWLGDATADFGLAAETGYNIRFYTDGSATERLRLTTAGQLQSYVSMKVQSGTGGSSAGFIVRPADNTDESTFFGKESYWTLIGANSNEGWKFRGSNGANAFLVNAGSFSYNATLLGSLTQNASDIRLKTNIVKIENALEKINTLEGFTYNWKEECPLYNPNSTTKEVGVSAQAVKDILPEVVSLAGFDRDNDDQTKSKSGENYLTIQYEKLVPLLIEGIKELKAEFEEYKATHP